MDHLQTGNVAELRATVENAVSRRDCPFCGSVDWWPPDADRVLVVTAAPLTEVGTPSAARTEAACPSWVCGGCGFLRMHVPVLPGR